MKRILSVFLSVITVISLIFISGCSDKTALKGEKWYAGFGSSEIEIPCDGSPLYLAGYKNGIQLSGTLDKQRVNSLWLGTSKEKGILIISVDCIGLSSDTTNEIKDMLSGFCRDSGCVSVNIFSTHDHAGADTLGLWGKPGHDGKNPAFMKNLYSAVLSSAKAAYKSRSSGKLSYGSTETDGIQEDSRYPYVYQKTMHQFRFSPDNGKCGTRVIVYPAHAESLGADNTLLSRDWPGVMSDCIKEECGDNTLFINGAIGGLIATSEQSAASPEENMRLTGERLAAYALSTDGFVSLSPTLKVKTENFKIPLDNTMFMYYRFLGISGNECVPGKSDTGYCVKTSLSVITIGEKTVLCLPCEIFPELVSGTNSKEDPEPLQSIAERNGIEGLIVAGLCNDEIGYVMPPSAFLTDSELPFIKRPADRSGESHYEETNSVGKSAAGCIADAFLSALKDN